MVMRQLRFELGEAYSTMMDLKYASVETSTVEGGGAGKPPKQQIVAKINSLTKSAIDHFQDFIRSFHVKDATGNGDSQLPEKFEDMNVRPVLLAFFHVARLYTKFVEVDPKRCSALWARSTKDTLAPLTLSLAPHYSLRSRAPLRSFARSLISLTPLLVGQ